MASHFSRTHREALPLNLDASLQARKVWELDLSECRRDAETVMAVPDHVLDEWNPPLACFQTVGCPNCDLAARNRAYNFTWSPEDPGRTICKHCGECYPSRRHPLDHITEVVSPAGTRQQYPYALGDDGWRYYMDSQMYNLRRFWLRQQAVLLAHLYQQTGEAPYAEKAGSIIGRFARIYQDIPIHGVTSGEDPNPAFYDNVPILPTPTPGVRSTPEPFGYGAFKSCTPPYPWQSTRSGLWNRWVYDEIPLSLILAYGQVADVLDEADRETIEDYFRQVLNYIRTYPRYLTNYDPLLAKGEIACGRVIGEPEFVHGGLIRINLMMRHRFYPDGTWCEGSPLYGSAVYDFILSALQAAEGYSDPSGYVGVEDGRAYESFDSRSMTDVSSLTQALEVMRGPDGDLVAIADTFGGAYRAREHPNDYFPVTPPETSRSQLLWACGHVVLGTGKGPDQIQARLQYMGQAGHNHMDRLGLQLHARGREMVSDIGYAQNNLRAYATSSFAHNLVLVDEEGQSPRNGFAPGDELLAFHQGHPSVQFASVSSTRAYPGASRYQRSLALVRVSETDAYLVDLFEVSGGSQHDWLLHGDADTGGEIRTDVETRPFDGSPFLRAKPFEMWPSENSSPGVCHPGNMPNALGLMRNARTASVDQGLAMTFLPDPGDDTALRVHMPRAADTTMFHGEIPSLRKAGTRNDELLDYWMPLLVARRTGTDVESAFLAVHEPYRERPFLDSVEYRDGAFLVTFGSVTDVHLFGQSSGEFHLEGRYGFLRIRDDRVEQALLADGTQLSHGNCDLLRPAACCGTVLGSDGRSLRISGDLPEDTPERIHLAFPNGVTLAPPVEAIERRSKPAEVRLKCDPGFVLSDGDATGEFTAFPGGPFQTPVRWRIPEYAVL